MRDIHQHKSIGKGATYLLAIACLIASASLATPADPGDLDPTFGHGGTLTDWSGRATGVVIQPDGKLIVAGDSGGYALARYNSDGSTDTTFGNGSGKVTEACYGSPCLDVAVALQPDGKIVVAGLAYYSNMYDIGLDVLRLMPDGSTDTGFGDGGRINLDASSFGFHDAISVHIQPDGKIVAAAKDLLLRLNPNGSPDVTFGSGDGVVYLPVYANGSDIQLNGKIVIAGTRWNGSTYDIAVARFDSDGKTDATFGSGGLVLTPTGNTQPCYGLAPCLNYDLAIQPDGKIAVGGANILVRYNENGSLDTGFGRGGIVSTVGALRGVIIQPDGKLLIAGSSNNDFATARYNPDGRLDRSFGGGDGISMIDFNNSNDSNDTAFALALDHKGRAVIVGSAASGSNSQFAIARLLLCISTSRSCISRGS